MSQPPDQPAPIQPPRSQGFSFNRPTPAQAQSLAHQAENSADQLYQQRQFAAALAQYQRAIQLMPQAANLHYKLAYAAWRVGQVQLVQPHFSLAVRLNPRHAWAHEGLALWYLHHDQRGQATRHSDAALQFEPKNVDFILTRAYVLAANGEAQAAWGLLEPILSDDSVAERAAILFAQIAPKIGHEQQAAEWVARRLSQDGVPPVERRQLLFAAVALFDRIGRYDEAFAYARLAHQLFGQAYDARGHAEFVTKRIDFFTQERFNSLTHATHGSRRPVFIVGMPRSGTSLVEQVLSCHPQIFAAGELDELPGLSERLQAGGAPYLQAVQALSLDRANDLAKQYLSLIDSRNAAATHVTDKMPLNFLLLDLVELLFPNSRVIHCTRHALDTCLSCYLTDFAAGNEFAGVLRHLGTFFRQYQRLMSHWKSVLRVPILDVPYEDMVADLEGQTRKILQFLDLPWEGACLEFHQNQRPVTTASREQVRLPVYSSSVGRWKHYQKHLDDLIATLAGAGPEV